LHAVPFPVYVNNFFVKRLLIAVDVGDIFLNTTLIAIVLNLRLRTLVVIWK